MNFYRGIHVDIKDIFQQFEELVGMAKTDKSKKELMGKKLSELLKYSHKTKADVVKNVSIDRTTLDRWLLGGSVPHEGKVAMLEKYLFDDTPKNMHRFTGALLTPHYRPIINFIAKNKGVLPAKDVSKLLTIADTCKGEMTEEMIRIVIGY